MTNGKAVMPRLDDYCRKILVILAMQEEKIRFNDLHDLLVENAVELSKPTLSQHLKHLTQKRLVIRKVEEVQNVSYEINHKKFSDFEKSLKSILDPRKRAVAIDEGAFNSASIDDQMDIVILEMAWRILRQLELEIQLRSEPVKSWGKSFELMWLSHPVFRLHEGWLLEKSEKDKEYREKILEKISGLIKEIEETKHGSS